MEVATITMDPKEARERLRHYRSGVHRRADAEWERAATAYEQLAEGTPLIVLSQAIQDASVDAKGRPRLAIARADRRQVHVKFDGQWAWFSSDLRSTWGDMRVRQMRFPQLHLSVNLNRPAPGTYTTGYSLVPMVPPNILEQRNPRDHFILWEVEEWADSQIRAVPDRDPYLLTRVADDLYAVIGEWDLTEVERAVMRDRATR